MIEGYARKGNKNLCPFFSFFFFFYACVPIIHTSNKKRPAARAVGRLVFLMESPSLNLGCHFDNLLYLIPCAAQDDVDDSVHVGDVDFAVTVHVTAGILATIQDDVDGGIDISNIDLSVAIHVTSWSFRD